MKNNETKSIIPTERIEGVIYIIRGHKVILDKDLAALYGVETKQLNRAVSRNQKRFPKDFIFKLAKEEWDLLKCQIGTSNIGRGGKQKLPMAFTEHGVAMASNLLKSQRAAEVSVEIVRAFIRMRQVLATHKEMSKELAELKSFLLKHSNKTDREFKKIWMAIDRLSTPPSKIRQRQIGFDLG